VIKIVQSDLGGFVIAGKGKGGLTESTIQRSNIIQH
jgi:hypothetical protein